MVFLRRLNCSDLILDWQGVDFSFERERLEVSAFPRDRRTKRARSEGLIGREISGYLGKRSRNSLGNIICDMPEEMEQVLHGDS